MPFEANLSAWLREQVRPMVANKKLHMCRVENSVGIGYPDIEGCYEGQCFHLELKGAMRPANSDTPVKVKFQPGQKPWLRRRWRVGGSCYVLLRVGVGRDLHRYLIPSDSLDQVGAVPEAELAALSIIPPRASGQEIIAVAANWRSRR